jgi:hypothetical protein
VIDAGQSAFSSEIWGDAEQMLQAFRRTAFSSVIVRLADAGRFEELQQAIAADPRLQVDVKPEPQFYEDQASGLSSFISIVGNTLSVIFSLGAIIGAAITMYAAVATRTGEIGTLRALGFRRRAVLGAFLLESILLARAGGGQLPAGHHHLHHQFHLVLRAGVQLRADPARGAGEPGVRADHGPGGRLPAGDQGGAHEDRRCAAGGLSGRGTGGWLVRRLSSQLCCRHAPPGR